MARSKRGLAAQRRVRGRLQPRRGAGAGLYKKQGPPRSPFLLIAHTAGLRRQPSFLPPTLPSSSSEIGRSESGARASWAGPTLVSRPATPAWEFMAEVGGRGTGREGKREGRREGGEGEENGKGERT